MDYDRQDLAMTITYFFIIKSLSFDPQEMPQLIIILVISMMQELPKIGL